MKKIIVAATFAVIAATSVASAADLAVKAPVYKAPAAVVSDWTGFYIGVNGGYGWGRSNDWSIPPLGAGFGIGPIGTGATGGGLFGGQIGYNWQIKSWVIGVQGDGDWSNIKGNATNTASPDGRCWSGGDQTSDCRTNYKAMGNLTAKLGYLFLPKPLYFHHFRHLWLAGHFLPQSNSVRQFYPHRQQFWPGSLGRTLPVRVPNPLMRRRFSCPRPWRTSFRWRQFWRSSLPPSLARKRPAGRVPFRSHWSNRSS